MDINDLKLAAELIKSGGIGVIPTDTLYGIVASSLNKDAVEKLRVIRDREDGKPFIVLISKIEDLKLFNITPIPETENILKKIWPAPVSIILPLTDEKFDYLTRGTQTLAVRLPDDKNLLGLISQTGPLVAPSVNLPGQNPVETIIEAKKYFPDLDFYVDAGKLVNEPSTLISIENGKAKIWRQGKWKIPKDLI